MSITCNNSTASYRLFGAVLGSGVTALGVAGNGLTLLAFAADRRLRTPFNLLILNMTLADLAYCGLLQPLAVYTYLQGAWDWGLASCQALGLLIFSLNLVSILSLALVAGSRYALVAKPEAFRRASRGWSWALALFMPWLLSASCLAPFWHVFTFLSDVCSCTFHRTKGRPYTTILHFLTFGLGLGAIAVCYFLLHRRLRRTTLALSRYRKTQPGAQAEKPQAEEDTMQEMSTGLGESSRGRLEAPSSGKETADTSGRRHKYKSRLRRVRMGKDWEFRRVTAMCFAMFLVYLGCYLPFCALHLLDGLYAAPAVAQMAVGNLTWLNSCLNPLLYAAMNRQFRQGYMAAFRLLFRCSFGSEARERSQRDGENELRLGTVSWSIYDVLIFIGSKSSD
ncbi:G-protein coupled receptor 84-like [Hypanus sabinus]|uniref:G-protein coupled receptor 84-like n=1 Tax=Hypanus sabinus TaxID=79690 RepID=UPI0028C388C3|nr:G-protein coupled receptor 84-like [Hypanus sabinus]